MVTLLMSYILMFPAFLRLRKKDPDIERPFRVGGKGFLLGLITYLPMILLIISVIFSIIPLNSTSEELGEKLPILIGTLVAVVIGEIIAAGAKSKNERKQKK